MSLNLAASGVGQTGGHSLKFKQNGKQPVSSYFLILTFFFVDTSESS